MNLRTSLQHLRYRPAIATLLYLITKPLYESAGILRRSLRHKIRRNGGGGIYDGIQLVFPRDVGTDFLSNISWLGMDGFEPYTWRTIRSLVEGAGSFIDIGANIGFYSVLARRVKPSLEIISFEPVPEIHRKCCLFAEANGASANTIEMIALSDANGQAKLFLPLHDHDYGESAAGTLATNSWQSQQSPKTLTVRTMRLDTFLENRTLPEPVVIKIDVEDFEAAVLLGAANTIKKYRPKIICEILPRQHGNMEVREALVRFRYAPFAITRNGCFRFLDSDFALPRDFTDFLLIPLEAVDDGSAFIPVQQAK